MEVGGWKEVDLLLSEQSIIGVDLVQMELACIFIYYTFLFDVYWIAKTSQDCDFIRVLWMWAYIQLITTHIIWLLSWYIYFNTKIYHFNLCPNSYLVLNNLTLINALLWFKCLFYEIYLVNSNSVQYTSTILFLKPSLLQCFFLQICFTLTIQAFKKT